MENNGQVAGAIVPVKVIKKVQQEEGGPKTKSFVLPNQDHNELAMPVMSRVKARANLLLTKSKAHTKKIPTGGRTYKHETTRAEIRISNIDPIYESAHRATITYKVYKTNEKGDVVMTAPSMQPIGDGNREIPVDQSPVELKTVTEVIEHRKPIYVEEYYV